MGTVRSRAPRLALVLLGLAAGLGAVLADAAERRAAHRQGRQVRQATVRLLGSADLVLSSSSRWLRHLSLSEPGAAFQDAPAILDLDPGGGITGPRRELLFGPAKPYEARP